VLCYVIEVWTINTEIKSKLNALEMDYLRSEGIFGRESEIMRLGRKLMHRNIEKIEIRGLKSFGHLMRMEQEKLSQTV